MDYTPQRSESDHYLLTQVQLLSRIQVLLAGIVAEEMIFDYGSTSAKNDLERATEIARSMVMDYGLSRLGQIAYRERHSFSMMGNEDFIRDRHSEQTAREIDEEIRYIINQSLEKVRQVLETHRRELVALAGRLIEKEVINAAELKELVESNSPRTTIAPGAGETPIHHIVEDSVTPYPSGILLPCDR
jgi:cell division protease FtsH